MFFALRQPFVGAGGPESDQAMVVEEGQAGDNQGLQVGQILEDFAQPCGMWAAIDLAEGRRKMKGVGQAASAEASLAQGAFEASEGDVDGVVLDAEVGSRITPEEGDKDGVPFARDEAC